MVKGLKNIKTLQKAKNRSIPSTKQSHFLEMYILQKERSRYVNEMEITGSKLRIIRDNLQNVEYAIKALEERIVMQEQHKRHSNSEEWQTKTIGY